MKGANELECHRLVDPVSPQDIAQLDVEQACGPSLHPLGLRLDKGDQIAKEVLVAGRYFS
jgi:hypothetical protein